MYGAASVSDLYWHLRVVQREIRLYSRGAPVTIEELSGAILRPLLFEELARWEQSVPEDYRL